MKGDFRDLPGRIRNVHQLTDSTGRTKFMAGFPRSMPLVDGSAPRQRRARDGFPGAVFPFLSGPHAWPAMFPVRIKKFQKGMDEEVSIRL